LLTTLTLEEIGNQTKLTLTWVPINATEEERKTFSDAKLGVQGGWTGSFDRLSDYLMEIRS
jgi:activator of Hsp90 ATPase-like protein